MSPLMFWPVHGDRCASRRRNMYVVIRRRQFSAGSADECENGRQREQRCGFQSHSEQLIGPSRALEPEVSAKASFLAQVARFDACTEISGSHDEKGRCDTIRIPMPAGANAIAERSWTCADVDGPGTDRRLAAAAEILRRRNGSFGLSESS